MRLPLPSPMPLLWGRRQAHWWWPWPPWLRQVQTPRQGPGAQPVLIRVPLQPRGTYRVQLRFPHDRTPGGRSVVEIDPCGGEVLQMFGMRGADFGNTSGWMQRALPTGAIFGWPTRVLACLVGVALILQAISGMVMGWLWGRRRLWLERCRKKPRENSPSSGRDGWFCQRVMGSPDPLGGKRAGRKLAEPSAGQAKEPGSAPRGRRACKAIQRSSTRFFFRPAFLPPPRLVAALRPAASVVTDVM